MGSIIKWQQANKNRVSGYYWVKLPKHKGGMWLIAEWDKEDERWMFCGDEELYSEDESTVGELFDEIDEEQIKRIK